MFKETKMEKDEIKIKMDLELKFLYSLNIIKFN